MRLLFLATAENYEDWAAPLRDALPGDEIRVFPDVGDPAAIDCALVAVPPPGELGVPLLHAVSANRAAAAMLTPARIRVRLMGSSSFSWWSVMPRGPSGGSIGVSG